MRSKALELQSELQQTESEADRAAKQAKRPDIAHADARNRSRSCKRFTAEKARVRKELRETQRGLDVDINRLDTWLKVINIAIAPLAVAMAGVFILSLRRERKSRGSPELDMSARTILTLLLVAALRRHLGRDLSEHAAQLAEGHARRVPVPDAGARTRLP